MHAAVTAQTRILTETAQICHRCHRVISKRKSTEKTPQVRCRQLPSQNNSRQEPVTPVTGRQALWSSALTVSRAAVCGCVGSCDSRTVDPVVVFIKHGTDDGRMQECCPQRYFPTLGMGYEVMLKRSFCAPCCIVCHLTDGRDSGYLLRQSCSTPLG